MLQVACRGLQSLSYTFRFDDEPDGKVLFQVSRTLRTLTAPKFTLLRYLLGEYTA